MVTSSKSFACSVTVCPSSGVWGSCGVCATMRLVWSAKRTRGERHDEEQGVMFLLMLCRLRRWFFTYFRSNIFRLRPNALRSVQVAAFARLRSTG